MSQKIHDLGPAPMSSPQAGERNEQAVTGTFQGERVSVVSDPSSLLADAAEELTFSQSEEVERSLSERKENKDKLQRQYMLYVKECEDIHQEDLDQVLQQLKALGHVRSASVLTLIRQAFSDPTHQHAALSHARHADPESLSDELKSALDGALETLEVEQGQAVQAGYNIVSVKAEGLDRPQAGLRMLYRDTVIDFESYEKTFQTLLDKFGPEELPLAVNYLIRALGADMTAVTPSGEKAALKEVSDGLYMVEALATIYREAQELLNMLENRHGARPCTERQLIEPLLRFKDSSMLLEIQVLREMPFLTSANPSQDAELTQGIRELARNMPHKLFGSAEIRQNILNTFQEILDKAIDREDAELEA